MSTLALNRAAGLFACCFFKFNTNQRKKKTVPVAATSCCEYPFAQKCTAVWSHLDQNQNDPQCVSLGNIHTADFKWTG